MFTTIFHLRPHMCLIFFSASVRNESDIILSKNMLNTYSLSTISLHPVTINSPKG